MASTGAKPHHNYIDCVRGYAVLLVMTAHYAYLFPNLPYPVHRVAVMGWYGVQLFFIASSLTLLMSWDYETRTRGGADVGAFFIRRFFRIAPAYYVAGAFYFFLIPPPGGFDMVQALASIGFVNAWHPLLTPTVANRWVFVPGGWSIGVEFTFYLLFPLFATRVRSLRAALWLVVALLVLGALANRAALAALSGSYRPSEVRNFLFFWFPNEMSVFGLGGVLFFLMRTAEARGFNLRFPTLTALGAVGAFLALGFVPLGKFLGARPVLPYSLAVCLPLMVFVFALSRVRGGLLVNRQVMLMGKVSFSAYLLHFATLRLLGTFPAAYGAGATGYRAILAFVLTWPVAAVLTFAAAWCSYRVIELPGMALGKVLIRGWRVSSMGKLF